MVKDTVTAADRKVIDKANALLAEAYRTLPEYAIKKADAEVITKDAIDHVQEACYEMVEGMTIKKRSKGGPVRLHWQLSKIGGRLKAAREVANYPHERQLKKKE